MHLIILPQLAMSYFGWHYAAAFLGWWRLYANASWFIFNFFSVRILLGTFFSPWKRLRENDSGETGMLGALIINLVTRLVGMAARTAVIGAWLLSLALLTLGFCAALVFWLAAPLVLFGILVWGVKWIF